MVVLTGRLTRAGSVTVLRCAPGHRPVQRRLRRTAHRPPPARHPAADGQGRRIGARALRRRLVQAAELDEPAVHAASRPTATWTVTNKAGEQLSSRIEEVAARLRARARGRSRAGEGRRRGAPAAAARRAHPHAGRRVPAGAARVPDADRPGRHHGPRRRPASAVAVEIKRRGEIDGVEQLTRYLELLNRDPLLAPVRGVFAAQEIKPQARMLAEDRGIRCRRPRLRRAARRRRPVRAALLSRAVQASPYAAGRTGSLLRSRSATLHGDRTRQD